MVRTLTTKLLLLFCIVSGYFQTWAQGWEKKYSPDAVMAISDIFPRPGGSCLITGWDVGTTDTFQRVMKVDANGQVLWKADIDSIVNAGAATITPDGGLLIIAMGTSGVGSGRRYSNLVRVDSNGQKLWLQTLHPINTSNSTNSGNMGVDTTDDGGFVCFFAGYDTVALKFGLYVYRLEGNGNIVWQNKYYTSDTLPLSYNIINSKDGGFIATAGSNSQASEYLFKLDGSGNILWRYQPPTLQYWLSATVNKEGSIFLQSTAIPLGGGNNALSKLNQAGQVLWTQSYNLPGGWGWYGGVMEKSDDKLELLVLGYDTTTTVTGPYSRLAFALSVIDTEGNMLYYKNIPTANLGNRTSLIEAGLRTFAQAHDGGFVLGGWVQNDPDNYSGFLIKMDSNGVVYPSTFSGYVYGDLNNNCSADSGEVLVSPANVTLVNPADTFTVITTDSGYFSLGLDTGTYSLHVAPPSPYWQASACNTTSVNLASGADTSLHLGFIPIVSSPYILINGYLGPQVVWCRPTTYMVEYCNYGTASFTGTIVITVDTMLTVDSASMQWASVTGNQYTFNVDTLNIMQCATFKMYCTVHCNSDLIGRTASIVSQAFQDTIIASPPAWDHSNVEMAVHYNQGNDSVTFTLANTGTGNMHTPSEMIVIEDNVILLHMPQQLPSGGQITQTVPANGSTWRVTIPQTASNPYSTFATAGIEAAGTNTHGGISIGFFTQFPYNGYTSYQYNSCAEIKSAYDPNQKAVTPKGAGIQALIDTTTKLEYVIDFQNTGNASAYTVTVIDTLPPYVNPATIRLEVSSSPCRMQLSGSNIVTFTFNNINLPDSSTSFLGSMGFVKFGIDQKPNNALGTVINNKAGIYFDYNAPVATNTATVRIGQLAVTAIQSVYQSKQLLINAYPNPFTNSTIIKVDGESFNDLQLNVYDAAGKLIKQQRTHNTAQFILNRTGMSNGNYIFEITGDGKPVGNGKIVAQ